LGAFMAAWPGQRSPSAYDKPATEEVGPNARPGVIPRQSIPELLPSRLACPPVFKNKNKHVALGKIADTMEP
jgi:hypothetical protein